MNKKESTLVEIIASINEFDAEDVIFAKPKWTLNSEAEIFRLLEDGRVPGEAKRRGLEYFLEVDVVRQVLDEFLGRPGASIEEKCERIIHYATYDA